MNAERIEVLHGSNCEAMVIGIADHFKLYFFPAFQRFFYQDLGCKGEGTLGNLAEFLFVGTNT